MFWEWCDNHWGRFSYTNTNTNAIACMFWEWFDIHWNRLSLEGSGELEPTLNGLDYSVPVHWIKSGQAMTLFSSRGAFWCWNMNVRIWRLLNISHGKYGAKTWPKKSWKQIQTYNWLHLTMLSWGGNIHFEGLLKWLCITYPCQLSPLWFWPLYPLFLSTLPPTFDTFTPCKMTTFPFFHYIKNHNFVSLS